MLFQRSVSPEEAATAAAMTSPNTSNQLPTHIWRHDEGSIKAKQGLCSHCGAQPAKLYTCSGCEEHAYCGKFCQRAMRPQHKLLCSEQLLLQSVHAPITATSHWADSGSNVDGYRLGSEPSGTGLLISYWNRRIQEVKVTCANFRGANRSLRKVRKSESVPCEFAVSALDVTHPAADVSELSAWYGPWRAKSGCTMICRNLQSQDTARQWFAPIER